MESLLNKEDIDFINKNTKTNMNDPKFQYSEFIKTSKRDAQVVVRGDDWETFLEDMKKIQGLARGAKTTDAPVAPQNDAVVAYNQPTPRPVNQPTPQPTTQAVAQVCPQCQSEMWDNRPKKVSGEFKPTSPDFKCKKCEFVIWPPKK